MQNKSNSVAFTPGPWEVVMHERFPFQREVKAENEYICDMEGLSDDDMPTVHANARLIAAAPEMYAALKVLAEKFPILLSALGNSVEAVKSNIYIANAKAALAKAEATQ